MIFLIDHNLRGHALVFFGAIANQGWLDIVTIRFITFAEMDLSIDSDVQHLMLFSRIFPSSPVWSLTPLIDVSGDYPNGSSYRFEWEREWRCIGDFRFSPTDVAFLVIPEEQHISTRECFWNNSEQNLKPLCCCPYIDSDWDAMKIKQALTGVFQYQL